jgi:hypothetical protein
MKLESLVIVDQHATVNTFPGLVHTARHTTGVCCTGKRWANLREAAVYGMAGNWGEVVTRYPYRKVRMDHLLSKEPTLLVTAKASRSTHRFIGEHGRSKLLVYCLVLKDQGPRGCTCGVFCSLKE